MTTFLAIIGSTFFISLGSLIGITTLAIHKDKLEKILLFLVSLSAGTLIGGAFLHLLPEALENMESEKMFMMVLISFTIFFIIEKVLHWRHCHKETCAEHSFGYMNLFGDAVHNFIDGLIIAATFVVDIKLGMITTLAVALHEIPQEIGDFGVLLRAGFATKKALIWNFIVASLAIAGGIVGFILSQHIEGIVAYLLPVAAGGFIYIAASDLMPEIRKEESFKKSSISFAIFILGLLIMFGTKFLGHE